MKDLNGTLRCGGECQDMILDNFSRLLDINKANQSLLLDMVAMRTDVRSIASHLSDIKKDNKALTTALLDDKKTWNRVFVGSLLIGVLCLMVITIAKMDTRMSASGGGFKAEIGAR